LEEGSLQDALEVEEEAHSPPPAQAQEDAPALQVSGMPICSSLMVCNLS